jgi:malto-oligosyltrehalose trehalohydrolase
MVRCAFASGHRRIGAMRIEIDDRLELLPMQSLAGGWHEVITNRAGPGSRYRFVLPDASRVWDPASRYQPEDLHGPSEVVDPVADAWTDLEWQSRPWEEAVLYEMHIGAFTPEGTFGAALAKLDHLVELGVTAIEIMPVGDFPGRRDWGYDGVLLYAPDASYGRPEELKALVDAAAHARGLMVLLDVVYNHFGPEGSFLKAIAPQFFTDRRKSPWGEAINMDGEGPGPVREYFIHNALYWIRNFISMGCASMLCTRSWTIPRGTCWRSRPSGFARNSRSLSRIASRKRRASLSCWKPTTVSSAYLTMIMSPVASDRPDREHDAFMTAKQQC